MRRSHLAALLSACLVPALVAQEKLPDTLTLDSLFHPAKKVAYVGMPSTRLQWASDGTLVEAKVEKGSVALLRVDPRTWEKSPLLDADKLRSALVAAGASEDAAKGALGRGQFTWRDDRGALLLDIDEDLYLVDLKAASAKRLTNAPGSEDEATFSPDGSKVAFLRGNDLYVVDVATAKEARLTTGGDETHFNGRLDWVYQEEVYGRGDFKAFWWSPDSKRLAYLSLDETQVPVHTLPDDRAFKQKLEQARYPKAGDPNPIARLGLVDLDGKTTWTADPYAGQETLIVQVGWTPAGKLLAAFQDRVQTWLDLRTFEGLDSTSLIREQGKAW
jgi:dipeptidyl-peptidase-4